MALTGNYRKIRELGAGRYGVVSLVREQNLGRQFVLKCVDLSNSRPKERLAADLEVKLLSTLRHPNIVRYRESFTTSDDRIHIIMEYCQNGDLHSHIRDRNGVRYEESAILDWFLQICMALQYLHDRNILHRDLKTQNIFLTNNSVIKVGDFGIARVLECTTDMATTIVGTPFYMSPEILRNQPYNHKSDIWALGCCLYEMCSLTHAFSAKDFGTLMYKVLKGKVPPIPAQYSTQVQKILRATLHSNADKRPSAAKILRHPFIKTHIVRFLKATMTSVSKDPKKKHDAASSIAEEISPAVVGEAIRMKLKPLHLPAITVKSSSNMGKDKREDNVDFNQNLANSNSITPDSEKSLGGTTNDFLSNSRKRRKSRLAIVKQKSIEGTLDSLKTTSMSQHDLAGFEQTTTNRAVSAPTAKLQKQRSTSHAANDRRTVSAIAAVDTETPIVSESSVRLRKHPKTEADIGDVEGLIRALNETLRLDDADAQQELQAARQEDLREFADLQTLSRRASTISKLREESLHALKQQCEAMMSNKEIKQCLKIIEEDAQEAVEKSLKKLLKQRFEDCAPLLFQLKLFQDEQILKGV